MKRKYFLLILISMFFLVSVEAQENDAYRFPIRPGTPEWKDLETYEARLNAYNVPEEILKTMSTKGLVETCLSYPEFGLIFTRNNLQHGYAYLFSIFNGFRELEHRLDMGEELLIVYSKLNPERINDYTTLEQKGGYSFQFTYLELILSQKPIMETMNDELRKKLTSLALEVYEGKKKLQHEYAMFGLSNSALVLAMILDVSNNQIFSQKRDADLAIRNLLEFGYAENIETLTAVVLLAKQHLND